MECPVCFEIYIIPLLLPGCGHTICNICAEALVTEGNFLKCPECRLVYQLRRGVKSLPKNVALQRTIEDHQKRILTSVNKSNIGLRCESHPEDNVTLYCRTCEKPICLKCYFTNTMRKGESLHSGHQVDTSDDTLSREKLLLEEACKKAESFVQEENQHIINLKDIDQKLEKILETKNNEIEAKKNELVTAIKLTASKLKFSLSGSIFKEKECLKESMEATEKRLSYLKVAVEDAVSVLNLNVDEKAEIKALKIARKKIEDCSSTAAANKNQIFEHISQLEKFDTNIQMCLDDPKRALSYQFGIPMTPSIVKTGCIVSHNMAMIPIHYHESVRTLSISLKYKEINHFDVQSDKDWEVMKSSEFNKGLCRIFLSGLQSNTSYKCLATISNDFGESPPSNEIVFQTAASETYIVEIIPEQI